MSSSSSQSLANRSAYFLFVNGIWNKEVDVEKVVNKLSDDDCDRTSNKLEGGYFYSNTGVGHVVAIDNCWSSTYNSTKMIGDLATYIIYILGLKKHLCIIAHSNGCRITLAALRIIKQKHPELPQKIEVHAFGGIVLIPQNLARYSRNYLADGDLIACVGSFVRDEWTWVDVSNYEFPVEDYDLEEIAGPSHTFMESYLSAATSALEVFRGRIRRSYQSGIESEKRQRQLCQIFALAMVAASVYCGILTHFTSKEQNPNLRSYSQGFSVGLPVAYLASQIGQRILYSAPISLMLSGISLQWLLNSSPHHLRAGLQAANAIHSIFASSKMIIDKVFAEIPVQKKPARIPLKEDISALAITLGIATYLLANFTSYTDTGLYLGLGLSTLIAVQSC